MADTYGTIRRISGDSICDDSLRGSTRDRSPPASVTTRLVRRHDNISDGCISDGHIDPLLLRPPLNNRARSSRNIGDDHIGDT